jgi:hypothetical protein
MVTGSTSPNESLLFAARLLQTAADSAEADVHKGRTSYVTEANVKVLLWLCGPYPVWWTRGKLASFLQ